VHGIIEVVPVKGLLIHVKNQYGEPASNISTNYSFVPNVNSSGSLYTSDFAPHYFTINVYSMIDCIGIVKDITAPGEYTLDTTGLCPINLKSQKIDGTILPAYFQLSSGGVNMVFPPCPDKIFVSPGNYNIIAYSNKDYYYLVKTNVKIENKEKAEEIILDASLMDTSSLIVTYDKKFYHVGVTIKSEYVNTPYCFNWINVAYWVSESNKFSETKFILSCGDYEIYYYLDIFNKEIPEEYTYSFSKGNIQICKGIATKIDLGKEIKCNIEISKKAYSPGSNVNINVFFGDEQGRFLTQVLYSYRMGYPEGKAYYLKPELLIKDQESKVVFNKTLESFYRLKESGFTFVIPSDWEEGDYTVTVSLDTGPLSGLVSSSCIIKVSKSYSVSATCSSEGKIFPSGEIRVNYGDSKTFTITPNTGYKIKDVKVDSVSVGTVFTYIFQNVTSDHTIEAIFEPLIYAINTSSGIGGSISPSGTISVNYGDSKTFTITPYSGYKISNVKVDSTSVSTVESYAFTNITSNHTISVVFEKEITKTVIILHPDDPYMVVNGVSQEIDAGRGTKPVIIPEWSQRER